MTRALAPLQEMSHERECAIMMIDHHNKLTGANCMDVIANISGSTAKGAVADSIWGIYREGGKTGAKLIVTGRDVIDQSIPVQMDWSTGCWQRDQDAEGLKLTGRRQEILDALEVLGQQVGVTEIALEVGQDKGNTYKRLQDLVSAGLVTRSEKGGDVYYSL